MGQVEPEIWLDLLKAIGASPGLKLDSPGRQTREMDRPVPHSRFKMAD